jgi:sodium transport system ATP-binding protein
MIQVQEISKTFTDPKRGTRNAVDRISFEVLAGEVFGLLGPNGAGKTTTLRLIGTLLKPTGGTAIVNGFDVNREPGKVREQIGFLSGDMGLYARLTPREILDFFGKLNSMDTQRRVTRIGQLLSLFEMESFADVRTDKLSTGMKQKTAIARTMLHDPPVLILDEPSSGLDVPTARTIEKAIMDAKRSGKCIVYSTHVMEEAEYLCDRIGVISDGRMKMIGTMDELRAATGKHRLREIFLDLLGLPADE